MEKYKVMWLGDIQQGVGRQSGQEWRSRQVVLEAAQQNVAYPDSYVCELKNEAINRFAYRQGDIIMAELSHYVHEYNGRYFQNCTIRNFGDAGF